MSFHTLDRDGMQIRTAPLGALATNCYVVGCARTGVGALIDAVAQIQAIDAMVQHGEGLKLDKILQTHAHIDHVAALPEARARYNAPIHLHRLELPLYEAAPIQGRMFGIHVDPLPPPDAFLTEGQTIAVGELQAEVLLTPGHSPGSVCFHFAAQKVIFSGDVLFAGSIGRTDLPGGDGPTLMRSLAQLLDLLPDDTLVLSGHGPATTIGRERTSNPFLTRMR